MHSKEIRLRDSFFNTSSIKRFYCPSRIHWGVGSFELGLDLIRDNRCWVFFDKSLEQSSFVSKLRLSAVEQSQFVEVFGPPTPELVLELAAQLTENPEFVVAIGGGSTMDLAKGIIGQVCFGSIDGIGMGTRIGEIPQKLTRPTMISFPSTAGTGAETSRYYVTYESGTQNKVHGKSWHLVFDWVFLDPLIAMTAPMQVKIESAFDTFVHLAESALCLFEESWPNYALCEGGLMGCPRFR